MGYDPSVARHLGFDPIEEAHRQWSKRWPAAADAMAATTSIMRAQQIVLGAVDQALRPFGLTFARYEVLMLLSFAREGELPLGKMGPRLMLHPTSVTNIVDRLEQDRLVARVPHPSDRRTTLAEITEDGRRVVDKATEVVSATDFGIGAPSDGELDQVTDPAGLDVHVRTRRGSPPRELAALASEFSADALVIGAPQRFWHHIAGSVSGWLARHADCPVVVVP